MMVPDEASHFTRRTALWTILSPVRKTVRLSRPAKSCRKFSRLIKKSTPTPISAPFGSPFNIHFDTKRLLEQMETYHIEKTILCPSGCHENEDVAAAYRAHPDKIIPLMWINCAEGQPAYDALEHYLRDEGFAGAKLSLCLTATRPTRPVWIRRPSSASSTESPCSSTRGTRRFRSRGRLAFSPSAIRTFLSS